MDSMRSLNTSLPSSTYSQPPEQLLQAFKTAALSVTNLYKTAVSDQANARHQGYQEALEDMRAFLDRECLGMDDGEASKIRNWVVDRIDGTATTTGDSDDDRGDSNDKRSSSPVVVRKESLDTVQPRQPVPQTQSTIPAASMSTAAASTTAPAAAAAATPTLTPSNESSISLRPTTFTFSAGPQYPAPHHQEDVDMQASESTISSSPGSPRITASNITTSPSVRVEVIPRPPRTPHRFTNGSRHGTRSSARESLQNAGSKRKFQFGDFFDISNLGGGNGGKRGRFI
jgi:hypothetical protein